MLQVSFTNPHGHSGERGRSPKSPVAFLRGAPRSPQPSVPSFPSSHQPPLCSSKAALRDQRSLQESRDPMTRPKRRKQHQSPCTSPEHRLVTTDWLAGLVVLRFHLAPSMSESILPSCKMNFHSCTTLPMRPRLSLACNTFSAANLCPVAELCPVFLCVCVRISLGQAEE